MDALPPAEAPTREAPPGRRRSRAAVWTLGTLVVVATALFALVVRPFWAPLLLAAILAAVFQPPLDRLTHAMKGRRRLASAVVTLGVLLAIVLPFGSVAAFLGREAVTGFGYVRDTLGVHSVQQLREDRLPPAANQLIDRFLSFAHLSREQLHDYAGRAADTAQEFAPKLLQESGHALFHTVVMLLAFYFLLADGRRLIRWLWNVSPLEAHQTEELLTEFQRVATGSIVGTVITAVLQGTLAGIGFAIFRVPHAIFFGLLTALASFIPVIGTALVWVPAALVLFFQGDRGAAIGLGIFCAVLVIGAEHLAKPLILRASSGGEMHTGLMFLALLGGLDVFGLLGVILGPLIVSFFVSVLRMLERDAKPPPALQ